MYKAIITKLTNVRPHPNADKLKLATVWGNQIVIGLDSNEDDIGIYFPTDGQLSEEFAKENNLIRRKDKNGKQVGGMFDENKRVRTQKFRGEISDGFWCPITYLKYIKNIPSFSNGEEFDTIGTHKVCNKYISPNTKKQGQQKQKGKKSWNTPMFKEHFDTAQLGYKINDIPEGSTLILTTKVHGTSQRFGYVNVEKNKNLFQRIFNITLSKEWTYLNGTRRVVLDPSNLDSGFHSGEMRQDAIKPFYNNLHRGETIYFEVVGFEPTGNSIMGSCNNNKLKDHIDKKEVKAFIKRYGETTTFTYGCKQGECRIFVYRITLTNEDGHSLDYSWEDVKRRCNELGVDHVPELDIIHNYNKDKDKESLLSMCKMGCAGASVIDTSHIEEGVCVRVEGGLYPKVYKYKSFEFKVLEGIIKDSGIVDMEESS